MAYNPSDPVEPVVVEEDTPIKKDVAPMSPIDVLDVDGMDDDQLAATIDALMMLKTEREAKRKAERLKARLKSAKIVGGEPWEEREVYSDIQVSYEDNGRPIRYIHEARVARFWGEESTVISTKDTDQVQIGDTGGDINITASE